MRHTAHVEPRAYLDDLAGEGARLAAAARSAGMAAPVPTCPGWHVADLLVHTARVFRHKTYVLERHLQERPTGDGWQVDDPAPAEAPDFFDVELRALLDALRGADPDEEVWTFAPANRTVGFWCRRMAHEAVIHRVDAETAAGIAGLVRPELAVDGVDEVLDLFLAPRVVAAVLAEPAATVHLHATDLPGEWLVRLGPDGLRVERGHAKGDAAVRGTASELLLWLWGRRPLDGLEVFGEEQAAVRLRAAAATVT